MLHLPIDDYLVEINECLSAHNSLVVTAEPGAGKTTRLPPSLLKNIKGKILVLEPRRVAALAAATRIAAENNWTLGNEVGYQVRFDSKVSSDTRLIFMTEAMLSRQILKDPELKGIGAIILDEFHERSLHVDLALGWIKELQDLGSTLKLVIMSATLQAKEIASYLGNASIVAVPGKLFPLEIQYQKYSLRPILDAEFYKQVSNIIQEATITSSKDILVFLPGVGEIAKLQDFITPWASSKNISVHPLHGSLTLEQQREVLLKGSEQRIILSTNIAESSVTVDGVGVVVDTGLSKVMRYDPKTGFGRLELGRISVSSATQRAGRAARQFEGTCIRLWSRSDEASMPRNEVPEIQRADLSDAFLFLAANGINDFENFSWFERPNPMALQKAILELQSLDAIDQDNRITEMGRKLIHYPLSPRLAKLMVLSEDMGQFELAADLVAILQERDFTDKKSSQKYLGDKLECDVTFRYLELEEYRKGKRSMDISNFRIQSVMNAAKQYRNMKPSYIKSEKPTLLAIKKLILHSHLDAFCKRRPKSDRALMVNGRGLKLEPESLVKESEFFVALSGRESEGTAETLVSLACGFDKDFILKELKEKIKNKEDLYYDEEKQRFFTRKFKALKDLPIDEPSFEPAKPEMVQDHIGEVLVSKWEWVLKNNEALKSWFSRWEYFRKAKNKEALNIPQIQAAFEMAALGENNLNVIAAKDLIYFFEMQIESSILQTFHQEVPEKIKMPTGSLIPVHYPEGRDPYLEVRIQEVFGLKETPKILNEKTSIIFHLLAPNYRPTQVTSDLKSFWQNGYPEVRKELRLRYPKHSWPEDPLTALPVAKGRPQKR